jgi:hypothetical protein
MEGACYRGVRLGEAKAHAHSFKPHRHHAAAIQANPAFMIASI